jgi:DNA polymerase-3 subunit alpha
VRVVVTKKTGAEMAFVHGKDDSGGVDLVVFPQLYGQTKDIWQESKPVLVEGKVNNRDDSLSVIVESVESTGQSTDRLYIRIPNTAAADNIRALKELLLENTGEQNVSLVFEGSKDQLDLGLKVNWTPELAKEISKVLEE